MLTFDLKQTPPSMDEIELERVHLKRELAKNKGRRTLMIVLFFLIPIAVVVAYWQLGLVDGKTAVFIAVVAALGTVAGFVVCATLGTDVGFLVCAGFVVCVVAVTRTTDSAVAVIGAIAGAIAVAVVNRLDNCKTNLETRFASLYGLEKKEYLHRSPVILQVCRQDAVCESYRLAVAKLGRALIVAEADMIEDWANGDLKRRKQREQQEACEVLKCRETVA